MPVADDRATQKHGLDLIAVPVALFALVGLGLSCTLVALQVVNPSRQILSLAHWQDYAVFFRMGERLGPLALLGLVASGCMFTCFVLWATARLGMVETWRRACAEGVPLAVALTWALQLLFLYMGTGGAVCLLLWIDVASGAPFQTWHAEAVRAFLLGIPVLALAAFALPCLVRASEARSDMSRMLQDARAGGTSLRLVAALALLLGGLVFSLLPLDPVGLLQVARTDVYPVPPFLWTHFGPAGIFVCVTFMMALLGLGAGIGVYGLSTDATCPNPRHRLLVAATLSLVVCVVALVVQATWLIPRYHFRQDLRTMLSLQPGTLPARTIAWLDEPRPAHHEEAMQSWSTPENMERLGRWMETAPWPSAQTRPAAAILGNAATWDWDPDRALHWLDVQRRRQPHDSNLNAAMVALLESTMPDATRRDLALAFTDPARFAWPGPQARLQVAVLLRRCGREAEAGRWSASAQELLPSLPHGDITAMHVQLQKSPPSGSIRGRVLLDGQPLASARVALFQQQATDAPGRLAEYTQYRLRTLPALVSTERDWKAASRSYMNFRALRDFYAVVRTDDAGAFEAASLDSGRYLLCVLLPPHRAGSNPRLRQRVGLPVLEEGRMHVDLGALQLFSE